MTTAPAAQAARLAPLHVRGELLATRRVGAYHHLTLAAPGIPDRFRPGTFVALSVGESHLARRAFWIHRVQPMGGYGATVQIVVSPVGVGTRWLAGLPVGARLDVTGPLGRPFALPKEPVSCVLVGEEYAAAPLFPLAERLRERGCRVSMVVAGRDEAHLLSTLEAKRSARSVTVVTRDGSIGQKGEAADFVAGLLRREEAEVVYGVGSVPTLHAVAAAAEEHGAWSQTAIEQPLTCATGLCQGCVVPVVGEDGAPRLARACADGPVFRGDRVRWAEVGR
jgi:dihydroorotate dehydrogenase electron transfer subunit